MVFCILFQAHDHVVVPCEEATYNREDDDSKCGDYSAEVPISFLQMLKPRFKQLTMSTR